MLLKSRSCGFCHRELIANVTGGYCFVDDCPDHGGPEAADSLDIVRHFGFRTLKKLNIIMNVLTD